MEPQKTEHPTPMFNIKDETSAVKATLTVILSLFFALCLFTILKYGNSTLMGSIDTYNNDDVKYIRSASILLTTGKLTYNYPESPTVFIMPGLPCMLSFFMRIFGLWGGVTAFRIFQAVLQTASLLTVFFIGRKVFNSKTALLAVFLNAIYIPDILMSNVILTETIFKFLFLLLIYICLYAIEKKKVGYYIAGGIVWGMSALFRPPIAAFPIVILIMWIKNRYKFTEILKFAFITAAVFVLMLSPWWIRNYKLFNEFIPFTASSGNPMLQGTYINYDRNDGSDSLIDISPYKYSDNELHNNKVETEIAKLRMKTLIPKKPLKYLCWYTIGKTINNWSQPFYWKQVLGIKYLAVLIYHRLLILLAMAGAFLIMAKRRHCPDFLLLIYAVVYINCIYLPFYCFPRYVYPAMPLVIVLSSSRASWGQFCCTALMDRFGKLGGKVNIRKHGMEKYKARRER